ncbi:trypsin-like peptidase domain-containing protein [Metasolibacillus meyeri]|uniref:Trypsin-like peptidase domain-containing protein n=1 Tax=Metasolibacillus meyeri TaxID=1071052 RepID=A0AAW9NM32_9BACL|nr:trypsin-like peptidase domain-containing protein [Metasolibacillus meyeri]MEC1178447.1 trypsin-like peptidase domain-containing protein [Metasolibacillus meyeri]
MTNFEEHNTEQQQLTPLQERLRREELEAQKKRERKNKGGSKVGYFMSGLSGIIVGALLVWLLLPSLVGQLPGTEQSNQATNSTNNTAIHQSVTEVSSDVISAVEQVSDAVVGITNIQQVTNFWNQSTSSEQTGSGSGVIYKIDGDKAFIVTNHHVIDRAQQLEVTLADGSKEDAELVGYDIWTDLAVVVIDSKNVKATAKFGDSDVLKQGETVIAIGNPLGLEFYGSVTKGIVSGKDRSVPVDLNNDGQADWQTEVLQTDAAINPGNSGGALINIVGELVGINSMKIAQSSVEGLGFSIPINSAIPIIEELEQHGEVKRPTMGVSLLDLTEVPAFYQQQTLKIPQEITTGVVVTDVVRGSAAETAGMQQYDVIVEMDGNKIENSIELRKHLYNEKEVGDTLTLKVYRQGEIVELQLTLNNNATL